MTVECSVASVLCSHLSSLCVSAVGGALLAHAVLVASALCVMDVMMLRMVVGCVLLVVLAVVVLLVMALRVTVLFALARRAARTA